MSDANGAEGPEVLAKVELALLKDGQMTVRYSQDEVLVRFLLHKGSQVIGDEFTARQTGTKEPGRIVPAVAMPGKLR